MQLRRLRVRGEQAAGTWGLVLPLPLGKEEQLSVGTPSLWLLTQGQWTSTVRWWTLAFPSKKGA